MKNTHSQRGSHLFGSAIPGEKVLPGYGRRGGDAKMHPSREQTGEEVGGLDGEWP